MWAARRLPVCGCATLFGIALAFVVEDGGSHGDGDGNEDVDEHGCSDDWQHDVSPVWMFVGGVTSYRYCMGNWLLRRQQQRR